jgi:hypothetical protein
MQEQKANEDNGSKDADEKVGTKRKSVGKSKPAGNNTKSTSESQRAAKKQKRQPEQEQEREQEQKQEQEEEQEEGDGRPAAAAAAAGGRVSAKQATVNEDKEEAAAADAAKAGAANLGELVVEPYKTIQKLLVQLADFCVAKNFFRNGNEFHNFTATELATINAANNGKVKPISDGYMFLDQPNRPSGMIRVACGQKFPKWNFSKQGDKIKLIKV